MILNPDKCNYTCLGKDTINDLLKVCEVELEASKLEMVLGLEIDHNLESLIKTRCSKAVKNSVHHKE